MGNCLACSPFEAHDINTIPVKRVYNRESSVSRNSRSEHIHVQTLNSVAQTAWIAKIQKQWTECADCDEPNPQWAETRRGILICLQCSGVHRSLGTDISKVRSLTLDKWTQEMMDNMQASNVEFNKVWEYHVPSEFMKPTSKTRRDIRTKYIHAKYVSSHKFLKCKSQQQAKPPVFATSEYDTTTGDTNDMKEQVGMREYTGIIQIYVKCANGLPKSDLFSDSDPYVVFDNNIAGQTVKTKVIDDNNDPQWNERLILSVNESVPVSIRVYDEDVVSSDDLLCTSLLNVAKECLNGTEIELNKKMDVEECYEKQNKQPVLTFSVLYNKM